MNKTVDIIVCSSCGNRLHVFESDRPGAIINCENCGERFKWAGPKASHRVRPKFPDAMHMYPEDWELI